MKNLVKSIAIASSLLVSISYASNNVSPQEKYENQACVINMMHLAKGVHFTSAGEAVFTRSSQFDSIPVRDITCAKSGKIGKIRTLNMFGFTGNMYRVESPSCNVRIPRGYALVINGHMSQYRPNPQPECKLINIESVSKT